MKFNDTNRIYMSVATGTAERKETARLASHTKLQSTAQLQSTQGKYTVQSP